MTVRAIAGLFGYNVGLGVMGVAVLASVRPSLPRKALLRLSGLAYMLGFASSMVALTLWLVVGLPLTVITMLVVFVLISVTGGSVATYRRRRVARATTSEFGQRSVLTLASAIPLAALVVVLEAIFRQGRLNGLLGFDEWDSWGPLAKNLYFSGHLQPGYMASLPGGSYPPGLSTVLASGMHTIGSADVVTIHLEYWFVAVGFAGAVIGLLGQRARPEILASFVLLVFVMPGIRDRSVAIYADLPLGYLVATSVVLVWIWLEDGGRWPLALATVVSAGAILAKREGIVLIASVFATGAVASWDRRRSTWPRLGLSFAIACSGYVAWAVWLRTHQSQGVGPASGLNFVTDLNRGWHSASTVTKVLFNWDLFLVGPTLAVAAVGLAMFAGRRRSAMYLGSFLLLAIGGSTVIVWSTPGIVLSDTDVVTRLVGTIAMSTAVLTPVVLSDVLDAWRSRSASLDMPNSASRRRGVVTAGTIILVVAALYPAAVIAKGLPRFPQASDCSTPATGARDVAVVFGYADSYPNALILQARARQSGFQVSAEQDGCGRVRVLIPHPMPRTSGEEIVVRARARGFTPSLVGAS